MARTIRYAFLAAVLSIGVHGFVEGRQSIESDSQDQTVYDEDVHVTHFTDLRYPTLPRQARVGGVVVIRVTLNDAGEVVSAEGVSGPKLLVPDSLTNAKTWRFQPNRYKRAVIVYEFRVDGACQDAEGSLFRLVYRTFARIEACTEVFRH